MATVTLKPLKTPELMLEAYNITPDAFAGKTHVQIAELEGREGKIKVKLGDFFDVSGNPVRPRMRPIS